MPSKSRTEKIPEKDWNNHKDKIVELISYDDLTIALAESLNPNHDFTET